MNNVIYLIIDSARYDTFAAARTPAFDNLGKAERRYSFASWTSPSHFVYLMGMTPHASPVGVFASEVYKQDYRQWAARVGDDKINMENFLPEFSLPKFFKTLGYRTHARVSMPIINQTTILSQHFDSYKLMPKYDDFESMVGEIGFSPSAPSFYFLNVGEAHYPYGIPKDQLPSLNGDGGVFRRLGDPAPVTAPVTGGEAMAERYFNTKHLVLFRERQIAAIEHVDALMGRLLAKCPSGTHVLVTSDHGELFGEAGYFGHGPIMHEKVFEVPFVEGRV